MLDSNTRKEVFAPKYGISSDIVTYKKVVQSNQKKVRECHIILYLILFKI